MQRRAKLAIVILVGLLLLALGVWLILGPFLSTRPVVQQPPSLPGQVTPSVQKPAPAGSVPMATSTPPIAPSTERMLRTLENMSRTAVERVGSGASSNGFLGYTDVFAQMTPAGRTSLLTQQKAMQQAHPASGSLYGISTRAVSSNLTQGNVGDPNLTMTVEAIQTVDNGVGSQKTMQGKRIDVAFVKQTDGTYLIDAFTWSDLSL